MTTAKAVSMLRTKLKLGQEDLASRLGVTIETISRWENGRRVPSGESLRDLVLLAAHEGQISLRDVFESIRKERILGAIGNLQSPGTQRRIVVEELGRWLEELGRWRDMLTTVMHEMEPHLIAQQAKRDK